MSLLAIDWGSVWTVTFLGFGLVFVILILLIFILQGFGKIFAAEEKADQKKAAAPAAPAAAPKAAKAADASEVDQAAIAMALHLYFNAVHDTESYKLTLRTKPTAWNDKNFGMNNVGF